VNQRPARAVVLLPVTGALVALFAIGLVIVKVSRQPTFAFVAPVIEWAILGFALTLLLTVALRMLIRSDASIENGAIVSWLVALHAGIALLVIPLLLLTVSARVDDIPGWLFPVLNKRWLVALYGISIATFVLFPVAAERWRTAPGAKPDRPPPVPSGGRHWVGRLIGIVAMAVLAWYFAGPPWNLYRQHRGIDWHEQLHLGSLQAIAKGFLPYIGPASTVYGPGSQILTYGVMKLSRHFDIVGFRTAFAVCEFAALLVVGIAAYWWLGIVPAVFVFLLAFTYSPMAFYYTLVDGTFAGFYGWANPLRYLAPLLVVPSLVAAVCRSPEEDLHVLWVVLLGIAWGIGAWFAQENLSMTAAAGGLVLALLWLTQAISLERAVRAFCWLVVGFAGVVIPVLLYYAAHGVAREFVRNYFLNPSAVAMGFSNMWWPPQDAGLPEQYSYYLTLPFLLVLAVCTLWRVRPLRLASPLDSFRARFLAFVCVQLVCFQTSLFRSDNSHVRNTMVALPFVLVLGFWDMPRWLSASVWKRVAARAGFVVLAVAVYPVLRQQTWNLMLVTPMARFRAVPASDVSLPYEGRVSYRRATALLRDEPELASNSGMSMRRFLDYASEIHDIVGDRKTYVAYLGNVYTGLLYFMADLTPAAYPLDLETMTINGNLRQLVIQHMRTHPAEYECYIGTSLSQTEAQVFLETHQNVQTLERQLGPTTVYVLLAGVRD
jgi:hypothetical protein